MSKRYILIFLIFFASACSNGGWKVEPSNSDDKNKVYIYYAKDSWQSLTSVFNNLSAEDKATSLRICCLLGGEKNRTHQEVALYFKKEIPSEFRKALESSGNLHNPALKPLTDRFIKAFKITQLYVSIKESLKGSGYYATNIKFEKFEIFKSTEPYEFHADIWVYFEKK